MEHHPVRHRRAQAVRRDTSPRRPRRGPRRSDRPTPRGGGPPSASRASTSARCRPPAPEQNVLTPRSTSRRRPLTTPAGGPSPGRGSPPQTPAAQPPARTAASSRSRSSGGRLHGQPLDRVEMAVEDPADRAVGARDPAHQPELGRRGRPDRRGPALQASAPARSRAAIASVGNRGAGALSRSAAEAAISSSASSIAGGRAVGVGRTVIRRPLARRRSAPAPGRRGGPGRRPARRIRSVWDAPSRRAPGPMPSCASTIAPARQRSTVWANIRSALSPRQSWVSTVQPTSASPCSEATCPDHGARSPHGVRHRVGRTPTPASSSSARAVSDRPESIPRPGMPNVTVAMQPDGVPLPAHPGDQLRVLGGARPDHEECGARAELGEEIEQPRGPRRVGPVVERERQRPPGRRCRRR